MEITETGKPRYFVNGNSTQVIFDEAMECPIGFTKVTKAEYDKVEKAREKRLAAKIAAAAKAEAARKAKAEKAVRDAFGDNADVILDAIKYL